MAWHVPTGAEHVFTTANFLGLALGAFLGLVKPEKADERNWLLVGAASPRNLLPVSRNKTGPPTRCR